MTGAELLVYSFITKRSLARTTMGAIAPKDFTWYKSNKKAMQALHRSYVFNPVFFRKSYSTPP
jgi:hypothetical protein